MDGTLPEWRGKVSLCEGRVLTVYRGERELQGKGWYQSGQEERLQPDEVVT